MAPSFQQNRFLGQAFTSDIEELINTLGEKAFYRDGSKTMEGPIGMDGNNIIGPAVVELNEQAAEITPAAGKISLYALQSDSKLYSKTNAGVVTELGGGAGGDVVGPGSSIQFNIPQFEDTTGKVISDSLISKNNIAQASSIFASNTLLRSDGTVKNIKDSVVTLDNSGVISGITELNVDNLQLDLNTISSTNTDGSIILDPNGAGRVDITKEIKIQGGSPGIGKVLTSNAAGVGSWTTPTSGGLPTGYLFGYEQVNTAAWVATFGKAGEPSKCRDKDDSFDLQWLTDTKNINTFVTGVGGITDTQDPVQSSTSYQVYIIGDSTLSNDTDILAIEEDTDITTVEEFTSSDYDVYRLIGWFRTEDAGTDIEQYIMNGKSLHRECVYTGNRGGRQILGGGSSTTFIVMSEGGTGSEDYTAPNSSTYTARTSFGNPALSEDKAEIRLGGSTLTGGEINYTISNGSALDAGELTQGQLTIGLNKTTRQTEYRVDSAVDNLYVYIVSFRFHL